MSGRSGLDVLLPLLESTDDWVSDASEHSIIRPESRFTYAKPRGHARLGHRIVQLQVTQMYAAACCQSLAEDAAFARVLQERGAMQVLLPRSPHATHMSSGTVPPQR